MLFVHHAAAVAGFCCLVLACSYAVLSLIAVLRWEMRGAAVRPNKLPPVTVLKPLCGREPGLYEHLRSFCRQDYPDYQIVFGVCDPNDPALAVVNCLMTEFPLLPIDIVVSAQQHGDNFKVGNLINMMPKARHDLLVIADSDTWVDADYLAKVTAPLHDASVGMVTCLYCDMPTSNIFSRLGAMYVNEWYMPSVMLAWLFGFEGYASGQTIGIRRDTLEAIGGLKGIANDLADDYRLGERIRNLGLKLVLSPYLVRAQHDEPDFNALIRHELRWLQTIRVLRPLSFRLLFVTFTLPLAAAGLVLTTALPPVWAAAWSLFVAAAGARLIVHAIHRRHGARALLVDAWLVPARDFLLCWVWTRCFFAAHFTWRGSEFEVGSDGLIRRP